MSVTYLDPPPQDQQNSPVTYLDNGPLFGGGAPATGISDSIPLDELPVATPNPGSHPTFSAPTYNNNSLTALLKGASQGGASLINEIKGIQNRISPADTTGMTDAEKAEFNKPPVGSPLDNLMNSIPNSRPGTIANVMQNIGQNAVGGLPAIGLSAATSPPVGFGIANGLQSFSQNQSPMQIVQNTAKGAILGKLLQLSGNVGSSATNALAKVLPQQGMASLSASVANTAGSIAGGGLASAAVSNGDPAAIAQGATLGAAFPQAPLKGNDLIGGLSNPAAYAIMKEYVPQPASDSKYGQDGARGMLNEGLTFNNIKQAYQLASQKTQQIGKMISNVIASSPNANVKTDQSATLQPLHDAIAEANELPDVNKTLVTRLTGALVNLSNNYSPQGNLIGPKDFNMTPGEAFAFKKQVDKAIQWDGVASDKPYNSALQDVYGNVRNNLNSQVPALKELNQRFGDMTVATKSLKKSSEAAPNKLGEVISGAQEIGGALGAAHFLGPVGGATVGGLIALGKTGAAKSRLSNFLYNK